jgi:hypothetical protein
MRRWVSGQAQAWWTIFGDPEVTCLTFGAPHPDLAYSQRVLESTIRRSAREQPRRLSWALPPQSSLRPAAQRLASNVTGMSS